ncbi:MAG: hypothetical protein HY695_04245 [Deltaproteobacteria bacterium]|nr:hypothetical protein [Deltaproteobacteria bacterium]
MKTRIKTTTALLRFCLGLLIALTGCSSGNRGATEELRALGFSETESQAITSSVTEMEANTPSPNRPATMESDAKMTVAAARLVAHDTRLLPFLEKQLAKAKKSNDSGKQAAYEIVIEMINQRSATARAGSTRSNRANWDDLVQKAQQLAEKSPMAVAYQDLRLRSKKFKDERKFVRSLKQDGKWSPGLLSAIDDTITKMIESSYDGDVGMRLDRELGVTISNTATRSDLPLLMWMYASLNLHVSGEFPALCSLMDIMKASSTEIEKRFAAEIHTKPEEVLGLLMAFMTDSYWWVQPEAQNI